MRDLLSRREFFSAASCFGAALAFSRCLGVPALAEGLVRDPRIAEAPLLDKGFAAVRQIGDGVFALISDVSKGRETLSNGGFIIGSESALIIEGHRTPRGAAVELEALRLVTNLPVLAAVDTHYHYDHSLGNAFYGGHGIPVWAHHNTPTLMIEHFVEIQGKDKSRLLAPLEQRIRSAATDELRKRAESDLAAHRRIFDSVDSTVIALPSRPLGSEQLPLKLDLGNREVTIEHYPGHTTGDLVIRVPQQNIVFTGDLLFNGWYPVSTDADMHAWLETLGRFAAFGPEALFVPGHGQLCGQEGVAKLRTVIEHLRNHALESMRKGLPLEVAQVSYQVPPEFMQYPIVSWSFCMYAAIADFYRRHEREGN